MPRAELFFPNDFSRTCRWMRKSTPKSDAHSLVFPSVLPWLAGKLAYMLEETLEATRVALELAGVRTVGCGQKHKTGRAEITPEMKRTSPLLGPHVLSTTLPHLWQSQTLHQLVKGKCLHMAPLQCQSRVGLKGTKWNTGINANQNRMRCCLTSVTVILFQGQRLSVGKDAEERNLCTLLVGMEAGWTTVETKREFLIKMKK